MLKKTLLASSIALTLLSSPAVFAANNFELRLPYGVLTAEDVAAANPVSLTLATTGIPDPMQGVAYSYDLSGILTITGDNAPLASEIVWSYTGTLPTGLTLSSAGILSGTPTVLESGTYTVTATHSAITDSHTYTAIVGEALFYASNIAASQNWACALSTTGVGYCWGDGYLLNGSSANLSKPGLATNMGSGLAKLDISGTHGCALTTSGGAKCWGYGALGALGQGANSTSGEALVDVFGLTSGVSDVVTGLSHSCAITTAGGLKCWGKNADGQLGDGGIVNSNVPVDVVGMSSGVTSVDLSEAHTCAVQSGAVKCWGRNAYGQIGNGVSSSTDILSPYAIPSLSSGIGQVAVGYDHTCATSGGSTYCWGRNMSGQLGDGTTTYYSVPNLVPGLSGVTDMQAEGDRTCTLISDSVKCWGENGQGQVGDGTTVDKKVPTTVSGLGSGVSSISMGFWLSCAIMTDNVSKCWGMNHVGQVGNDNAGTTAKTPAIVKP